MVPISPKRPPLWLIAAACPTLVLLVLFSGSALVSLPEGPATVYDASPRLWELNQAVHTHVRFVRQGGPDLQQPATTLARSAGSAHEQVLLLMAITRRDLGVEPRLALIRLSPSGERRVVMEWRGAYYDPGLNTVYSAAQVAGVVRALSYQAALAEATL